MEINFKYIAYFADIIWLFPVFRQRKNKYFLFFLSLSLVNPVAYFTYYFIVKNMYLPSLTFVYLAFLSFFSKKIIKDKGHYFLLTYIIFLISYFSTSNWKYHAVIQSILIFAIILMVAHNFMLSLLEGKFNIFIIVIIAYLFLQIIQGILFITMGMELIRNYVYFAHFTEILLAVFFITFRADDDRLSIRL